MSEIPGTTGDVVGTTGDVVWQSSPPGSIYDYIRVASFSIGPDGLIEQWSSRAAGLFGMSSTEAIGRDPVEAFMPAELRSDGHRRVGEILDGKEWTGLVPFRMPGEGGAHGVAEVYVMPSLTGRGSGPRSVSSWTSGPCAASRRTSRRHRPYSVNLLSASCCSAWTSPSSGPTSASPPSSAARPTTTGAARWRTICRGPRPTGCPPP